MIRKIAMVSLGGLLAGIGGYGQHLPTGSINRKEVVQRHTLHLSDVSEQGPTQVGNGHFAYGFDITGMQTLHDRFSTMSDWSWHTSPPPAGLTAADYTRPQVEVDGRMVPFDLPDPKQPALSQWLAANPHRFNLGRIGLWLKKADGSAAGAADLQNTRQHFDLWSATAVSTFTLEGQPVKVTTVGDPREDAVAFKIESPLLAANRLGVFMDFPYAGQGVFSSGSDYHKPQHHTTTLKTFPEKLVFDRGMDSTRYRITVNTDRAFQLVKEAEHRFRLSTLNGNGLELVVAFDSHNASHGEKNLAFGDVLRRSRSYWPEFWNSGGFIDLSGSRDSRWKELERRIVLSQFAMKINASGDQPPQETGLVSNSWYGRFHYEMIIWHMAHYALWNRWPLLNTSLQVYRDHLPGAVSRASEQGYAGARFPKCTGPDGREWPHPIHAFLVWQQPHPVFFAALDYRAHPSAATLEKWLPVVEASANFLASYASFDSLENRYVLKGPISFVSENNDYYKDRNPAFELVYWRYGLRTARELRAKAGLPENPLWNKVYQQLAPVPVKNGLYEQWENADSMWTKLNFEHPALLGIYGLLPGDGVDPEVMRATFEKVTECWKWDTGWGWDFPMAAMTAARLGKSEDAVNLLLHSSPKNSYDSHAFVGGGNPYPYFPANGGLLYAVAFMTAGWEGDGGRAEPGFPKNGSWVVKWEGLEKAP